MLIHSKPWLIPIITLVLVSGLRKCMINLDYMIEQIQNAYDFIFDIDENFNIKYLNQIFTIKYT